MTILAYSPLAQGLLTGKYSPANPPPGVRGTRYRRRLPALKPLIGRLRDIGAGHGGRTPGQVALNWLIAVGAVPIPGAKTAEQATENAGGVGWSLSDDGDRRTEPGRADMTGRNRLAEATSPYLLQHADNPVHWWPWGDEAFAEARERDVPVFLSVGYAACHWCHVMAHESFEDEQIGSGDQRQLRRDQGRPGGAAGRRCGLHAGHPGA